MPTENGQGAGKVSMSGGWLLSVGSHATNKQMAFNFITHRPGPAELAVLRHRRRRRSPAAPTWLRRPAYKASSASITAFSSFVPFTHFRPAYHRLPEALH